MEQIFQNINKQMMETIYTLMLSQLLKIPPDPKKYMWQKLKPGKPNKVIQMILEPSVATMMETHFEIDIIIIEVDNRMAVIQVQVGKNTIKDVLLDGKASVNIITKNLKTKLGLSKPRLAPYHFEMVDLSMTIPLGIIKNLKIHINGIPYVATFIVLQNIVVDSNYFMLLKKPWVRDAKVKHDWGNNVIIVQGNGAIKTILVNKKLGAKTRRP